MLLAGGCSQPVGTDEHLGADEAALTAAQCSYFDVNGKTAGGGEGVVLAALGRRR